MDSLLNIETKKQKLRQTDQDFNLHSVSLLSQAPLARGSSALTEPLFKLGSTLKSAIVLLYLILQIFFFSSPPFIFSPYSCLELPGKPRCVFDDKSRTCRCPVCSDITERGRCLATQPCPESKNPRSFCIWRPTLQANSTFSAPSGECACCTPTPCPQGQVFDNRTCSCVCPAIKCPPGRVLNRTTCRCDCPKGTKDIEGKCVGE